MTWNIIDSVQPDPYNQAQDYRVHGVLQFDGKKIKDRKAGDESAPLLELFMMLWPGNWKQQLQQMNIEIKGRASRRQRVYHPISEQEFWIFVGIICRYVYCVCLNLNYSMLTLNVSTSFFATPSARSHGKGGEALWDNHASKYFILMMFANQ